MKKIFLLSIIILYTTISWSAPLKNAKIQIKQPNGKIIDCFATGDEYYNWLHDKDNYTIVQNLETGYYCYAINQNDELIASKFVVGVDNPSESKLVTGINYSSKKIFSIRNQVKNEMSESSEMNKKQTSLKSVLTTQTLNNIVIYVRFADQTEFPADQQYYNSIFNSSSTGSNSMYNYFREASYNNFNIVSSFYPTNNGSAIISYKDSHIRDYYRPLTVTNDSGYTSYSIACNRESALLENAVNYVKNQIPTSLNIDYNNDGNVDDVCFIFRGNTDYGNIQLWPHADNMFAYINSKKVQRCNLQFEADIADGGTHAVFHEMYHILGAIDLYNYDNQWFPIVGEYLDIMSTYVDPPPSICAFNKYKYGNWISSIPEITQSGHYSLNSIISASNNCYRISSPSDSEYFLLEFRKKEGTFESSISGTGLVIYRINTKKGVWNWSSHSENPAYQVYVFRKNGSYGEEIDNWGEVFNAHFDSSVGRSSFHNLSNPYCFLSDGSPGNIYIKNITVSGDVVSFDVRFCDGSTVTHSNTNQLPHITNAIDSIKTSGTVTVKSTDNIIFEAGQEVKLDRGFEIQLGGQFSINMNGCGNQ